MPSKRKKEKTQSSLADHKLHKKKLQPPFLKVPNLKPSSWVNERLPDMMWAALVVGNMELLYHLLRKAIKKMFLRALPELPVTLRTSDQDS